MRVKDSPASRRFGWAWIASAVILYLHILEELFTDFMDFYNPAVEGHWLLPRMSESTLFVLMTAAVAVLLFLSPWAFRGGRIMRLLSLAVGLIIAFNGIQHLAGWLVFGWPFGGVVTAPLMIAVPAYMIYCAVQLGRNRTPAT